MFIGRKLETSIRMLWVVGEGITIINLEHFQITKKIYERCIAVVFRIFKILVRYTSRRSYYSFLR